MDEFSRLLVEQRIKEYDMRLRHVDEVLSYAKKGLVQSASDPDTLVLLSRLEVERNKLADWLGETRRRPPEAWKKDEIMRTAGPMGIWDAIALQVEKLVERFERR